MLHDLPPRIGARNNHYAVWKLKQLPLETMRLLVVSVDTPLEDGGPRRPCDTEQGPATQNTK